MINVHFAYFISPAAATSPTASAGVSAESTASDPSAEVAGTPPEEQMTRYADPLVRWWFRLILIEKVKCASGTERAVRQFRVRGVLFHSFVIAVEN